MGDQVDLGIDGLSSFEPIGSGGFATVYSAWDESFNRTVAVKLLHSLDEDGRRRFERERSILGRLSDHPNVVTPFRFGFTEDSVAYLVMEHMAGGSLQDVADRDGFLDWATAIDYLLPIGDALGHGHQAGVLHRDVKPANVLLTEDGAPKLADYGIASLREVTSTQQAFTLAHSPPETFASGIDHRDERSDLYSLASSLYTLIVGHSPYEIDGHDSAPAFMRRIEERPVPDIEGGPVELNRFLARALAKDPADRPATAAEFAEELRTVRSAIGRDDRSRAHAVSGRAQVTGSDPSGGGDARPTVPAAGGPRPTATTSLVDERPEPGASSRRTPLLVGFGLALVVAGLIAAVLWRSVGGDADGGNEALVATESTPSSAVAPSSTPSSSPTTEPDAAGPTTSTSRDAEVASGAVEQVTVGFLYDVGDGFPGGPNELVALGLGRAREEFGVEVLEATWDPAGPDREDLLRELAGSSDLVMAGVGSGDAMLLVAEEHPDVHFVLIDAAAQWQRPNVLVLPFAIHEGSYLVGVAAALKTETGKVGFLGPARELWFEDWFRAAFEAGARAVDPDIEIDARYISEPPDLTGFNDIAAAERVGREMYEGGVDIIYELTGFSSLGVLQAADGFSAERGRKVWTIGGWNDSYVIFGPGLQDHVLTSWVSRWDVAVMTAIELELDGYFVGTLYTQGLDLGGVAYSTSGGFVDDITDELDDVAQQIIGYGIEVPTRYEASSDVDG